MNGDVRPMVGDSFTCPSCRMRCTLGAPIRSEPPHFFALETIDSAAKYRVLLQFAAEFDQLAGGERFTATEFLWWLEPSILGSDRHRVTISISSLSTREGATA